jgi:hypothetical protein
MRERPQALRSPGTMIMAARLLDRGLSDSLAGALVHSMRNGYGHWHGAERFRVCTH